MKHLFLILTLTFSLLHAQSNSQNVDIEKKAILKLIESNRQLEERVSNLEKQLSLSVVKKETGEVSFKKKIFFTPKNTSSIRNEPSTRGRLVSTLRTPKSVEIFDITCKGESVGYWGKSAQGWIFISNPSYGFLSDEANAHLSQDYNQWCKKH